MACKIKFNRINSFVKSSFIANSVSKEGGGFHYYPFMPFCCCSFGTKKTCTVEWRCQSNFP